MAFDKVPHARLIKKVEAHGVGEEILNQIKIRLIFRKQRVSINGVKSAWNPVCGGVPWGSVLRSLLSIIHIKDIDSKIGSNISKFPEGIKIGWNINSDENSIAMQEDLTYNQREQSDKCNLTSIRIHCCA